MKPKITQEFLREIFTYNSEEGTLEFIGYAKYILKPIKEKSKHHSGYRYVNLFGKSYAEHRLIWIYHYEDIPEGYTIDHINRIRDDNRIENLRLADTLLQANNKSRSLDKVGNIYVAKDGRKKKYRGAITFRGKKYNIKGQESIEEAKKALLELHNKLLKEVEGYKDVFEI